MMGVFPKPVALAGLCHRILPESKQVFGCIVRGSNTQVIAMILLPLSRSPAIDEWEDRT